jgi:DNA polymerase-3 subunit alpha
VLPPDINESESKFIVSKNSIRFGLAAVKNVGGSVIDDIVRIRNKNGKFKSFTDFCDKVDSNLLNKRLVESLIKCGAFDSLGARRSQLMAVYETIIDSVQRNRKNIIEGQVSLFDTGRLKNTYDAESLPDLKEFDSRIKLGMEKEMLGIYVSGHPLDEYENVINRSVTLNSSQIAEHIEEEGMIDSLVYDGSRVKMGGIVLRLQNKITKNNNLMCFMTLEDFYGEIEVIVFPKILDKFKQYIKLDAMVIIDGRLSFNHDEEPKLIAEKIAPLNQLNHKELYLKVEKKWDYNTIKPRIIELSQRYPGNGPVFIYFEVSRQKFKLPEEFHVDTNNLLMVEEFKDLLGERNVRLS